MSAKRRRLSPGPSGESFLEQHQDEKCEILIRLPVSSVFQLRSVCKQWLSLTTSSYFIGCWERHHAPFRQDPPLVLVLQHEEGGSTKRDFFLCSGVPEFNFSGLSLHFLPGLFLTDSITIVGSCEDLLLCCDRKRFQSNYFIVNPITRQWFTLPHAPKIHRSVLTGFVCEPASIAKAKEGGELRYRVVRIPFFVGTKTEFNIEIFSSEDRPYDSGMWKEYAMTLAEGVRVQSLSQIGLTCNGIVYWKFTGQVKVIMLDPFNPKEKGIRLAGIMPDIRYAEFEKYVMGICKGKLRMSQMTGYDYETFNMLDPLHIKIWELENDEAEWRLVQEVPLLEMLAENPWIVHFNTRRQSTCRTLAFDPNDEDIIYLVCTEMNKVICCNLIWMTLEIVDGYDWNESFTCRTLVFPFVLPWWPTLVPVVRQKGMSLIGLWDSPPGREPLVIDEKVYAVKAFPKDNPSERLAKTHTQP